MRYPIASIGPEAVPPVEPAAGAPPRDGTPGDRTFADLLAQAEAVQDQIDVRRNAAAGPTGWRAGMRHALQVAVPGAVQGALHSAVQGAVHGAAGLLARQTPWLGLPLLLRRTGSGRRG